MPEGLDPIVTPQGGETPAPVNPEGNPNGEGDPQTPKVLTQEYVNKIVGDLRKEFKDKSAKEIQDAIKKTREETLAEANLTNEQKEQKRKDDEAKNMAERENTLVLRENKAEALETLAELGISRKLVDFVVSPNKDEQAVRITTLAEYLKEEIAKGVADQLKGTPPTDLTTTPTTPQKGAVKTQL